MYKKNPQNEACTAFGGFFDKLFGGFKIPFRPMGVE
jgi:hypothetical protein